MPEGWQYKGHCIGHRFRGSGHNIAGSTLCDDGIVIDFSRMKAERVAARRCLTIEGNATLVGLDGGHVP